MSEKSVLLQGATEYLREIQQLLQREGIQSFTGALPGSG